MYEAVRSGSATEQEVCKEMSTSIKCQQFAVPSRKEELAGNGNSFHSFGANVFILTVLSFGFAF